MTYDPEEDYERAAEEDDGPWRFGMFCWGMLSGVFSLLLIIAIVRVLEKIF